MMCWEGVAVDVAAVVVVTICAFVVVSFDVCAVVFIGI